MGEDKFTDEFKHFEITQVRDRGYATDSDR